MEVRITDMRAFLTAVDDCAGDVYLVYPQGGTENLRGNFMRQSELVDEWRSKGQDLTLALELDNRRDQRRLKRFALKQPGRYRGKVCHGAGQDHIL